MAARIKLGELCHVVTKGTTPTSLGMSFADEGVPFLRIQNLRGSEVKLDDVLYIDNEVHQSLSRSIIKPKDFLITIAGTIGRVAIVPDEFPECNCNQAIAILRFDNERLDARWLYHWLSTSDAMGQIAGKKVTATISNLSLGQIKDLGLPLPYPDDPEKSLKEQKRIAAILDKADGIRRKRQQAIQLADDFLRSVFLDMFGDPVTNPKDFPISKLGENCEDLFLGLTSKVDYVEGNGYPLIRAKDINTGELKFDDVKFISEKQHKKLTKNHLTRKGDLLVSKSGTLGTCAIVRTDREFSTYESIFTVRPKLESLGLHYLIHLLQNRGFKEKLLGNKVGGTVAHLNLKMFRDFEVGLPPISLQDKFSNKIEKIEAKLEKYKKSGEESDFLFSSLSQKAFKGEL